MRVLVIVPNKLHTTSCRSVSAFNEVCLCHSHFVDVRINNGIHNELTTHERIPMTILYIRKSLIGQTICTLMHRLVLERASNCLLMA